jgi:Outer membrane protein beta-barrel domain
MTKHTILAVGVAASLVTAAVPTLAQGQPPSINVTVPRPPPADQPLIRNIPRPTFSVEGGAGLLGYLSGTGRIGPAWNLRVTGEFTPRFAAEAGYLGAANRRSDDTGTLTYTTVDAGMRYNILLADEAPVQPFLAAGLGYAAWIGPGGAPAGLVVPVSLGVERMLTEHVKIGARLNLRPSFFEDLGHGYERNPPGGSTWALTAGAGGAF